MIVVVLLFLLMLALAGIWSELHRPLNRVDEEVHNRQQKSADQLGCTIIAVFVVLVFVGYVLLVGGVK